MDELNKINTRLSILENTVKEYRKEHEKDHGEIKSKLRDLEEQRLMIEKISINTTTILEKIVKLEPKIDANTKYRHGAVAIASIIPLGGAIWAIVQIIMRFFP